MSEENVEIVRCLYQAFERGDNESPFEVFDPGIEWDIRPGPELKGSGLKDLYLGHDGVRAFWRSWLEAWSEIDFDYEVVDLGDDRVAGLVLRQRNHGRTSGIWVDQEPYAQVWTLRGGKVVRMEFGDIEKTRRLAEATSPQSD